MIRVSQLGSTSGGDNLGKMAKNCMKITKSAFMGQNSGGDMGGQANFLGSGGDPSQSPPVPPLLGETLHVSCLLSRESEIKEDELDTGSHMNT